MIWILGLLKGVVAHPKMTMGIAAVGVGGLLWVGHAWQVRGLRNDLEKATVALAIEKGATAELRIGVADVSANRDKLESRIREQGQAITVLSARASAADARARAAAIKAGSVAAAEAVEVRSPTTRVEPGYGAMNRWLSDQFP